MKGLTSAEVQERFVAHGYNELPSARPRNILRIALEVVKEPMFLLLISCSVLYMILGDYREGIIMLGTVLVIIFITFYQYSKTERALQALKNLSSPRALVIRDGAEIRIPGRELVPDDLLVLNEGDRIAADAKLIQTEHLTVDESMLTGESVPVIKTAADDKPVYSGTLVVQGSALAKVLHTGSKTEFGKIGLSLAAITQDETRLQKEMKRLIRRLFIASALISVSVVILFYFNRGNLLQSLLYGLTAAMAILPEEFPVVMTVFLALGAWRLSKNNVLTRKSSAIETLGAATVLCSDKTGTITQNKMQVALIYDGHQQYETGAPTGNNVVDRQIIGKANMATRPDSIDPMEIAIRELHEELNKKNVPLPELIREYPFNREQMAMTRVIREPDHVAGEYNVFAKGAPEGIFSLCKLKPEEKEKHTVVLQQMAEQGYRVIAVADAWCKETDLPDTQSGFAFTFRGLLGLTDPVRPEVKPAVQECYAAGIRVIMITGDYPATAASIARQVGLPDGEIITGDQLDRLSDEELSKRIKNVTVFARVVPEQKLRIVEALKANREVVAMTGDGVNDAPALKAAHIGVAMGQKGTDVAREAASLVLLDDNFASIVTAIRNGRRIFDNLQKAMSYILAIHMPIIGLSLLPAFIPSLPVLLMPLHIVFMELIIDPVCSVAFESELEEKGIMRRPPRSADAVFFGTRKILRSFMKGILLLLMVAGVYFISIQEGHMDGEVRAIAFTALITGNIFLILTSLSKTRTIFQVLSEKNYSLIIILLTAFIMLLLTLYIPTLREVFSFTFPGYSHFIVSFAGSLLVLLLLEGVKFYRLRKEKDAVAV